MVIRVENLPPELWISIFSYLEAHDLFKAFNKLNTYFDHLLASNHLSFHVRLTKKDNDHGLLSTTPFGSETILNRIVYLHWTGAYRSRYFPQYLKKNATQFTRLRSLVIIKTHPSQISRFIEILRTLNALEYLSIKAEIIQPMSAAIFDIPFLRMCELESCSSLESINFSFNRQSTIEVLKLIGIRLVDESVTNRLLSHMPKLKRLEISGRSEALEGLTAWIANQSKIFPQLPTFKITYKSNFVQNTFLEWLKPILSIEKSLQIDIVVIDPPKKFLQDLDKWWPIMEKIRKLSVWIRVIQYGGGFNIDKQNKFDIFRKTVLSKNDQENGRFNIKWTETRENQGGYILLELTIKPKNFI